MKKLEVTGRKCMRLKRLSVTVSTLMISVLKRVRDGLEEVAQRYTGIHVFVVQVDQYNTN